MFKATATQGGSKLRDLHFYKAALILAVLAGVVGLSFAANMEKAIIPSTGRIIPEIVAKSGYWQDIQDAVNLAASSGIGIVRIPEGTWNFVNVGESWTGSRVVIPAGVSIFGAPTERYENGSVKEWRTVLVMPWDMPGDKGYNPPHWFLITGTSDPAKPVTRFSDIKLVGYGAFDSSAIGFYRAIVIKGVINFRIDHCCFDEIREGIATGLDTSYPSCGVIDHCVFDNENVQYNVDWSTRQVGYALAINSAHQGSLATTWVPITDVLGKYTNYTVFIEDCVFTRWRSVVTGEYAAHYVFRHNIVKGGLGNGEVDCHPSWSSPYVGCRAAEIYGNTFTNPITDQAYRFMAEMYSGGGVFFNNTVSGYEYFIMDSASSWNPELMGPKEVYIWDNVFDGQYIESGYMEENVHYFLRAPNVELDGFEYIPYPYPHPLTLE